MQTFLRIVVPPMLGGIERRGAELGDQASSLALPSCSLAASGALTVVMFQALEGGGAGLATAAASALIVVTLLPIALLFRLVRRYELS